jgi:hypothetical protein
MSLDRQTTGKDDSLPILLRTLRTFAAKIQFSRERAQRTQRKNDAILPST